MALVKRTLLIIRLPGWASTRSRRLPSPAILLAFTEATSNVTGGEAVCPKSGHTPSTSAVIPRIMWNSPCTHDARPVGTLTRALIPRRLFHTIDHQHFHGAAPDSRLRFQSSSELCGPVIHFGGS